MEIIKIEFESQILGKFGQGTTEYRMVKNQVRVYFPIVKKFTI